MTITEQKIIPNGWHEFKLGEGFILSQGKYLTKEEMADTGYPVYGANGIIGHSKDFMYEDPTVLVSCRGANCGFVHITKPKSWVSNNSIAVLPKTNQVDPFFLYYKFYHDGFNGFITGSAQPQIVVNVLARKEIVIPPINEQKKIAEILSSVDKEIEKIDEIITQTEKLKKGLIQDLFTKNNRIIKLKLKDISEVTSSKRVMVSDYVDDGIPFYRSTEIIKKSKNIPLTNLLYISTEKFNFFKDRFGAPENGDILITAVGTIGDVYMVQNEVFYFKDGNTIWVRKIKDSVLPEYLRMILGSNFYREKLNNIAGGSSQKALTIQKLENVEVPVPSISEQKKLIEVISSVENKTKVYTQTKNNLNQLKKGLVRDLLSGNKRVKI